MTGVYLRRGARAIRPWLLPVAALPGGLIVLWAAGGLNTVNATDGRRALPDHDIVLARWVLTIHRVELIDSDPYDTLTSTAVRLHLRVNFTGQNYASEHHWL
jgi:hypothetical protein